MSDIPLFPDDETEPQLRSSDLKLLFWLAFFLIPITYLGAQIPSVLTVLFTFLGGLFFPSVLFVVYWGGLYMVRVRHRTRFRITLGLAITIGVCSLLLFATSFRAKYVAMDDWYVWGLCNLVCMAVTGWVVYNTYKSPSRRGLMTANYVIFVWLLTYAFPWLGERI